MPRVTLEERIEMSLQRFAAKVFLRKEFDRFEGYDQSGSRPEKHNQTRPSHQGWLWGLRQS